MPTMERPVDSRRIHAALVTVRARTRLPVALGGPAVQGDLQLNELTGTTTESLRGLCVLSGSGLGGLATSLRRPVAVRDYPNSTAITHEYDWAVEQEGLRSLAAVPVVVSGQVRAVIYGGLRSPSTLGERILNEIIAVAQKLAVDVAADDERERMIASAPQPGDPLTSAEREEIRKIFAELRTLAVETTDTSVRARLQDACTRFTTLSGQTDPTVIRPLLTPREVDALAHAAVGCSNAEIAAHLDVGLETVKSYLRSAMSKMRVHSRLAAVTAARSAGYLP